MSFLWDVTRTYWGVSPNISIVRCTQAPFGGHTWDLEKWTQSLGTTWHGHYWGLAQVPLVDSCSWLWRIFQNLQWLAQGKESGITPYYTLYSDYSNLPWRWWFHQRFRDMWLYAKKLLLESENIYAQEKVLSGPRGGVRVWLIKCYDNERKT